MAIQVMNGAVTRVREIVQISVRDKSENTFIKYVAGAGNCGQEP